MKKGLILVNLIFGVMLSGGCLAAEPLTLTVDEALYRAFATNPAIKIAGYDLDAARANMNAARLQRGITISGNHNSNRGGYKHDQWIFQNTGWLQTKGLSTTHTNSLTASMPIYTGGELSGNILMKKAAYHQAVAGKQKSFNDMRYDVTKAYYDCLLTKDLERVAQESVVALSQHLQHVKDSYAVGVVAKVDVLRSEVELADAEQNLISRENSRKLAMHNLNKIVGLPLDTELNLTDTLKNEAYGRELEACLNFAQGNRPELEQVRQGVRSAKGAVKVARSGYMPKISINATEQWSNSDVTTGIKRGWPGDNDETWGLGAVVSWNIFDSGVTWSNIHAAEAGARKAKETLRDTEDSVMLDVRNCYYNLTESERRIQTTNIAVAKAQEDYDIARLRYENGVGTNTDVLDAQVALTTAKTNYIQACYDFSTNKIALDNAIGVPFKSPVDEAAKKVKVGTKKKNK